ncbi:hypothetical protein [Micromonospora sp. RTP1Z1]|uniref:hypothetical protein n=1 Tax=Micromonospora sp. RTP1Z1 TaxID=2994043 RepID=UPI0029C6E10D|nr:hypothetical protein [Micromonospora sp. RTP1Z1]
MRKIATFAAAMALGGGLAVLGGGTAAYAHPMRSHCFTTMPVVPRGAPQPSAPKHCGKNTHRQYAWLRFGR